MANSRTATAVNMMAEQSMSRMSPLLIAMQRDHNRMMREVLKIVAMTMSPPVWKRRTMEEIRATLRGFTRSRNMKKFKHPFRRY